MLQLASRHVRCVFVFLFVLATPGWALQPLRVADGVYAFIGEGGEINASNGGNVANSGFIVGASGVIVIDTGPSYSHGRQMIAAIGTVTDQPIALVIITHAVQEFVFGAAAFIESGTPLLTHAKSAELMRSRCNRCLQNLIAQLGAPAMEGTRLIIPERTIEQTQTLRVGGRDIDLLHFGWAATPGDIVVADRATGVAFTGAMVVNRRIPEIRDGQLTGWLGAIDQLKRSQVRAVVPGYGAPGGPELLDLTSAYLRALDSEVQRLYQRGATLTQAVDNAGLPAYFTWDQYPTLHRQNVLHRYLQLESEELSR